MKKSFIKVIILLIFTSSNSIAEISGKVIAYACYSCHGENLTNIDQSNIVSAEKLENTLLAFKSNTKQSTIMNRITKGFSDAELKAVATYLTE